MGWSPEHVTLLVSQSRQGDQKAASALIPILYKELRRLANAYMRRERPDHTLQATALVHEAYLKLVKQEPANWNGRSHFLGIAAHQMRRLLIDHARGHLREKRGGHHEVVSLNEALVFSPAKSTELIRLNEALERLAEIDPRQSKIVGISAKTVKRDWAVAKAWLHSFLKGPKADVTRTVGNS